MLYEASNVELTNLFCNYLGNDNEADNEESDNESDKNLIIDCDEDLLSISQIEDEGEDEGEDEDESVISIIVIFQNLSFY